MHSPSEFVEELIGQLSNKLVEHAIPNISEDIDLSSPYALREIDDAIERLNSLRDIADIIQRDPNPLTHLDEVWGALKRSNTSLSFPAILRDTVNRFC